MIDLLIIDLQSGEFLRQILMEVDSIMIIEGLYRTVAAGEPALFHSIQGLQIAAPGLLPCYRAGPEDLLTRVGSLDADRPLGIEDGGVKSS